MWYGLLDGEWHLLWVFPWWRRTRYSAWEGSRDTGWVWGAPWSLIEWGGWNSCVSSSTWLEDGNGYCSFPLVWETSLDPWLIDEIQDSSLKAGSRVYVKEKCILQVQSSSFYLELLPPCGLRKGPMCPDFPIWLKVLIDVMFSTGCRLFGTASMLSSTERWSRNTLRVVTARVFYVLRVFLTSPFILNNSLEMATPFNVVSHPRCCVTREINLCKSFDLLQGSNLWPLAPSAGWLCNQNCV